MQIRRFNLDGPVEILPSKIGDERGYFSEIFRLSEFTRHAGPVDFVQDNQSLSVRRGTVRGLHFQSHPAAQGKLVRCLSGKILDVAVDIRADSPTYGRWVSVTLSPDDNNQLWVPVGFAHGFCTLEASSIISYRVTSYYSPENDKGLAWDDADIGVAWPDFADPATLSAKDRAQPKLSELPRYFEMDNSRCA